MGEMNTAAISANELVLIMASIATIGVIGGWFAQKLKLPDVVIYLILGVAFGPTFLNLVNIEAFPTVNEIILTFGSAFILYEGGREVKLKILNEVKVTVGLLASLGVFITAGIIGLTAHYVFNLGIGPSFLLGATIASTDPAALIPVFKTVPIKNKLKQTVISESAFNDAFGAILFTSILTGLTMAEKVGILATSLELVFMILIGLLVGIGIALIAVGISSDKKYGIFHGYAPIISITVVVFAYEISERFGGSGYMAVFIAGLVYGNKKRFGFWVPDEDYISGVHFRENIATIARMSIFIVLGTHLNLNSLLKFGMGSIIVVLVLMFIARPIVVLICTAFDKKTNWSKNEKLFMMWVRETGVIPAALSGIIVSTKVEGYEIISSAVFMTIIVTLLIQASTTNIVAKKLEVLEK
ncbi:cation:proton antiporter [Romboutsia lituseburensis]|uniref:cation:proton antiporter n=1 Tax=Romboutsia lituseburensis TaxID=1537 RepID=UPI00215A45E7|nr:sodium:proton antiporter [Romboutsia lituseburensis]MCR8744646.1 sodium:proton antiporter [Romboutsia lituseburensis]